MMDTLKKNKNALIFLTVVVVGFLLWKFVFKAEAPLIFSETQSETEILAQDLENQLSLLRSLRDLETEIFTDPLFANLQDIEIPIQFRPIGKSNPFLLSE